MVRSYPLSPTSTVILLLIEKGDYTLNSHFGKVSVKLKIRIPGHWGHCPIYKPIWPGLISSELGG